MAPTSVAAAPVFAPTPVVAPPVAEPPPVVEPPVEVKPAPEPEPEPPQEAPAAPARAPKTFASDFETSDAPVRNAHYRKVATGSEITYNVRVYNEAEELDIQFAAEPGEYVLDAAERAGFELPYSCRSGGCLTCSGKVHAGDVEMGEQYVLEDEHQAKGFILLCLTSVRSDAVFESHQQDNIG